MRILLWHGYLLSGSGSNIYTANLCREWRKAGHDVLLLCQERGEATYGCVDEVGDFDPDNRSFRTRPTGLAGGPGRCRLVRPSIGNILPVYVYDRYEGFIATRFVDLSDDELDAYTDRNVEAMATAIVEHRPDAIITGHEVMGPFIAKLACERTKTDYLAKLHGSALEYAVKLQERYLRFATEGLCAARVVVGGSEYMVEEASATVPGWRGRAVVVNPGCDVELFRPVEREPSTEAVVGYVGKLIAAKGVHDLLVALGETTVPLRAVIVGYGEFEGVLRNLASRLKEGDVDAARALLEEVGDPAVNRAVDFLTSEAAGDAFRGRLGQVEVAFAGRLEHDPLSRILPTFDVLVVPSVVSEAFGLVAAEAAASGVLPVVPNHSGIGEAGAAVEAAISRPGWLTFDSSNPVTGIADALERVLAVSIEERRHLGRAASRLARSRWSWRHVSARLLDLAVG